LDDGVVAGDGAGGVGDNDGVGASGGRGHAGDGVGRAGCAGDRAAVFAPDVGEICAVGDDGQSE